MSDKTPTMLYKYKAFDANSLDLLLKDQVFLSDPVMFNDPLDCRPIIQNDISDGAYLREIFLTLKFREFLKIKGKELEHSKSDYEEDEFKALMIQSANNESINYLEAIESMFGNDRDVLTEVYSDLIGLDFRLELLKRVDKGVLSLAKNNNCPLMWSHYADQHKGYCFGYSLSEDSDHFAKTHNIKRVDYKGSRIVLLSHVDKMLSGSREHEEIIDDAIYFKKAPKWGYEEEYRMVGKKGLNTSPFELKEVVFGMRCKESVKYSVITALKAQEKCVNFYEIKEPDDGFDLKIVAANLGPVKKKVKTH